MNGARQKLLQKFKDYAGTDQGTEAQAVWSVEMITVLGECSVFALLIAVTAWASLEECISTRQLHSFVESLGIGQQSESESSSISLCERDVASPEVAAFAE